MSECRIFTQDFTVKIHCAMPKLDERILHMRSIVLESVQQLLDKKVALTECAALKFIYKNAKKRNAKTGFDMTSFSRFYGQYKWYKSHTSKTIQNNPT